MDRRLCWMQFLEPGAADARYPLLFQRIRDYEPQETDESRNLLCGSGAAMSAPAKTQTIGSTRMQFGEWVTPPQTPGKLYGQFSSSRIFCAVDPSDLVEDVSVYIRLEYENGVKAEFSRFCLRRRPADCLSTMFLTVFRIWGIFLGGYAHKVRRFQIAGPGVSSFHQDFEVNWVSDSTFCRS